MGFKTLDTWLEASALVMIITFIIRCLGGVCILAVAWATLFFMPDIAKPFVAVVAVTLAVLNIGVL